jgi:hypothetical protein
MFGLAYSGKPNGHIVPEFSFYFFKFYENISRREGGLGKTRCARSGDEVAGRGKGSFG